MKGKMKKLIAFALAAIMVLAMGITASAAGGSITVSNATKGEHYQAYKIFDASYASKTQASYVATESQKTWFEGENSPFTFEPTSTVNADGEKLYNVKSTASPTEVSEFFKNYYNEDATLKNGLESHLAAVTAGDPVEATEDTITFSNLTYGYYLVTSTLGSTVSVNTTTPSVTVIDKNQSGPSIDDKNAKKIVAVNGVEVEGTQKNSVSYGDEVKFRLTIATTNYDKEKLITQYDITDTVSQGMTVDASTIVVKVKGVTDPLTVVDDYTLTTRTNGFQVSIPWVNGEKESLYDSPAEIVIEYTATVGSDALPNTPITNTMSFTYNVDGETDPVEPEVHESTTESYTYALAVNKVKADATGLAGAKFQIKKGNDVIAVKATAEAGVYNYAGIATADNALTEATAETAGGVVVSPASGLIVVKGVNAGNYVVTETEAPAGYNLYTGTKTVTTVLDGTYTKTIITYKDADGKVTETETEDYESVTTKYDVVAATVVNETGSLLPSTGGIGTTIFYVVGGILVAAAGVLLITKKRMSGRR